MNSCAACGHLPHGEVCNQPLTEDKYVSESAYGGRKYFYRSVIVDICGCQEVA
jgi:hypothetical protein